MSAFLYKKLNEATAEIERLQMELRILHQDNGTVITGLQGVIKELTAALYKIVDLDHYDDATIARKALRLPTTDREHKP